MDGSSRQPSWKRLSLGRLLGRLQRWQLGRSGCQQRQRGRHFSLMRLWYWNLRNMSHFVPAPAQLSCPTSPLSHLPTQERRPSWSGRHGNMDDKKTGYPIHVLPSGAVFGYPVSGIQGVPLNPHIFSTQGHLYRSQLITGANRHWGSKGTHSMAGRQAAWVCLVATEHPVTYHINRVSTPIPLTWTTFSELA